MSNLTRQQASYPRTLFLASRYLRRRIEEHQDELKYNADTLNAILVEIERMEAVLGADGLTDATSKLSYRSFFGDGSDGNLVLNGPGLTLSRDMYYENLTVDGSSVIQTNGYRIFVRNTLGIDGFVAAFTANGNTPNAGLSIDESGAPGNVLGSGKDGGAGVGTGAGDDGVDTNRWGSNGGLGGTGSGGAGGTNGAVVDLGTEQGIHDLISATAAILHPSLVLEGGAGGGQGGGDGSSLAGGRGAGGGGVLMIAAYRIQVAYTTGDKYFEAKGGVGENSVGDNTGAGGGGGGGTAVLLSHIIENTLSASATTPAVIPVDAMLDADAGNGGLAVHTGSGAGGNANHGTIFDVRI